MSIEDAVLEKLRALPPEKQHKVLDFVESLAGQTAPRPPRRSLMGLFADQGLTIAEEEIDQARRELWGKLSHSSNK